MTKVTDSYKGSLASQGAGAPDEIEVTPQMIEAGIIALREFIPTGGIWDAERYGGYDNRAVEAVFRAMIGELPSAERDPRLYEAVLCALQKSPHEIAS